MANVYQAVTDKIIEQLENGVVPWHKPWNGLTNGAFNRVSKKQYSLLNQMLLKHDGEYATFKQWNELGGKIKKGEKAEIVVFWKMIKVKDTDGYGDEVEKTIPILKYFNVFHISQVEGVKPIVTEEKVHEPIEEAERVISDYVSREGIELNEVVGNEAYYSPMTDRIVVPSKKQYEDINEYYSTAYHEMVHSTGNSKRLNRFDEETTIAPFGPEDYSKEELVAEIGASFLMSHVGIDTEETLGNSAAYINSWLNVLKGDNKFIVSAASRAEKATKYILGI